MIHSYVPGMVGPRFNMTVLLETFNVARQNPRHRNSEKRLVKLLQPHDSVDVFVYQNWQVRTEQLQTSYCIYTCSLIWFV